jgi:hypothetical protein
MGSQLQGQLLEVGAMVTRLPACASGLAARSRLENHLGRGGVEDFGLRLSTSEPSLT